MGLKRDSIRSRLSRDKEIPSYLLKLLPVLYIYTYATRGVPQYDMLQTPTRQAGSSEASLSRPRERVIDQLGVSAGIAVSAGSPYCLTCQLKATMTPSATPANTSKGVCPRSSLRRCSGTLPFLYMSSTMRLMTRACLPAARLTPAASYRTMRDRTEAIAKRGDSQLTR